MIRDIGLRDPLHNRLLGWVKNHAMHAALSQYELPQWLTENAFVGARSDGQIEVPRRLILSQDQTIHMITTSHEHLQTPGSEADATLLQPNDDEQAQ